VCVNCRAFCSYIKDSHVTLVKFANVYPLVRILPHAPYRFCRCPLWMTPFEMDAVIKATVADFLCTLAYILSSLLPCINIGRELRHSKAAEYPKDSDIIL